MDDDLAPTAPADPVTADGAFSKKPRRRFGTGIALGLGLGVLAMIMILIILAAIVFLTWVKPMTVRTFGFPPGEIKTVQLDGPWLNMIDAQHGSVVGWSGGGTSSGDNMPHGAIAGFSLAMATQQDGVPAVITVQILVTPETDLLMGGQPWKPGQTGERSAVEVVFGMFDGAGPDMGYDYLNMRQLTVKFLRDGDSLIAESIDASTTQQEPPAFLMGGY